MTFRCELLSRNTIPDCLRVRLRVGTPSADNMLRRRVWSQGETLRKLLVPSVKEQLREVQVGDTAQSQRVVRVWLESNHLTFRYCARFCMAAHMGGGASTVRKQEVTFNFVISGIYGSQTHFNEATQLSCAE